MLIILLILSFLSCPLSCGIASRWRCRLVRLCFCPTRLRSRAGLLCRVPLLTMRLRRSLPLPQPLPQAGLTIFPWDCALPSLSLRKFLLRHAHDAARLVKYDTARACRALVKRHNVFFSFYVFHNLPHFCTIFCSQIIIAMKKLCYYLNISLSPHNCKETGAYHIFFKIFKHFLSLIRFIIEGQII